VKKLDVIRNGNPQ